MSARLARVSEAFRDLRLTRRVNGDPFDAGNADSESGIISGIICSWR